MNKIIQLIKENRIFIALLVYHILIAARIFIEMEHLTLFIFIHQLFWFTGVMIWFFFVFKHILKVDIKKLWFFAGGGIITYIPLVYATLKGEKWSLNYVTPESFFQIVRDMGTLLINHPRNWPMFPELIILLAFTLSVSICLSKNIPKSFLTTILAVYGSFFIFGFSWISVSVDHPSALVLKTAYGDPQKFYALYMMAICSVLVILTVIDEIPDLMKKHNVRIKHFVAVFLPLYAAIISGSSFVAGNKMPQIADIIVLIPTTFLFSSSLLLAFKTKSFISYAIPLYFSIFLFITLFYNSNIH